MRNYKIKKDGRNLFGGTDLSSGHKIWLKENGYSDFNGMGVLFIKRNLGNYLELHIHADRPFIMFCYGGEGCRPFTPAELELTGCEKETQKNIRAEVKKLKEVGLI